MSPPALPLSYSAVSAVDPVGPPGFEPGTDRYESAVLTAELWARGATRPQSGYCSASSVEAWSSVLVRRARPTMRKNRCRNHSRAVRIPPSTAAIMI